MPGHPADNSVTPTLSRAVRRALKAMRANVERDWNVPDLASIAGVSCRTLQRQFRICLGKAPAASLRDIRFEHARRALFQGSPDTKVIDVARRCGFSHWGRFSVEYRRRYGETPSQTRQRQAIFIGALSAAPSFVARRRAQPTVAIGAIASDLENVETARDIAADVSTALTRAGAGVTDQLRSARYRLYGELRGSGHETRLTLRLIDGETGHHLWAHRVEGVVGENAVLTEGLATRVAAALQPCLRRAEIEHARRKPEIELSPYEMVLRAIPDVLSLHADGNARALDLLERAMERDPDHALAASLAAWVRCQRVAYHFTASPQEERSCGAALARKVQALADDPTVLAVLGNALTLLGELDTAELVIRRALLIDGGSAWAWSRSGWIDVYRGDPRSAIERFKIALELAPHDPLAFNSMVGLGHAHFEAGRYREAVNWQERALLEQPSAVWIHRTLCASYLLNGAQSEARRSLVALREHYPELTVSEVRRGMPSLPKTHVILGALHEVGLPR